ncbi:putative non-specific serine/threonine protein kinase [Helianthus annuus]|uniref:Non-specific serine/threonine protein kinase n=1 Tax=Helianthus annuus TaxID=4232 RepID=A0A9K3JPU4_HELAN|nr:putative non-specific serine/threonine protein kinase [Helianthus annuus]
MYKNSAIFQEAWHCELEEVEPVESFRPPLTHSNTKKLQKKIVNLKVKLLPWLSGEAHSFLKGLLQKYPTLRLGSWTRGCHDIKNHKWVNEIASEF